MHFLDEVRGHLAGTEAGHLHLRSDLLDLRIDLVRDLGGGDRDQVGALEPFVAGLLGLHGDCIETF